MASAPALPPSNEEVMSEGEDLAPPPYSEPTPGGSTQGANQGQAPVAHSGPGLMFVDFLPRCTRSGNKARQIQPAFENFKYTSTYLNQWLAANPGYCIVSLEEVTRLVNWDGSFMLDTSIGLNVAGINLYIRALRVWLRPRSVNDTGPVQVIGYFNYIPPYVPKNAGDANAFDIQLPMVNATLDLSIFDKSGVYLNLDNTLQMLNSRLASQPVPGQVIAVNSVRLSIDNADRLSQVRVSEDMADETLCSSKGVGNAFFTFIRVYYVCGPPQPTQIGMVDFVPEMTTRAGGVSKPQFEPFITLSHRAGQWIHDNDSESNGLRVINIQTIAHSMNFDRNFKPENIKTREPAVYLWPGERLELRILRVSFLRQHLPSLRPLYLTTRTFVPVIMDLKVAESGAQTLHRINAWLRATGVSVFGVDTLTENYSQHTARCDPHRSASYTSAKGSQYSMKVIRLYLNGTFIEPQAIPVGAPVKVKQVKSDGGKSSSCALM